MSRAEPDLLSALLADVEALRGASCAGTGVEFVDISRADADVVIRDWCHDCPVIAVCRGVGDHLAPHAVASVYGGRFYERNEPADGWPEGGAS